jgi:hypothetical protein
MKSDLYTKIILTLIAGLLSALIFVESTVQRDVRIVAIVKPSPLEIGNAMIISHKNIWNSIPIEGEVDANVSGSVDVDNTVDVEGTVSIEQ